ncbi:MAG: hypothetical protein KF812_01440 [Fimbriimonadaceae bacterium]|nr:hypothetical protein [Fimbriimonadaceae bacterium]
MSRDPGEMPPRLLERKYSVKTLILYGLYGDALLHKKDDRIRSLETSHKLVSEELQVLKTAKQVVDRQLEALQGQTDRMYREPSRTFVHEVVKNYLRRLYEPTHVFHVQNGYVRSVNIRRVEQAWRDIATLQHRISGSIRFAEKTLLSAERRHRKRARVRNSQ